MQPIPVCAVGTLAGIEEETLVWTLAHMIPCNTHTHTHTHKVSLTCHWTFQTVAAPQIEQAARTPTSP